MFRDFSLKPTALCCSTTALDSESLAGPIGDLGDLDRVIAEEKPVAVVAAGRDVVVVADVGVKARRIPSADRA